jgi:Arc/MetJ family transcription regulator
MLGMTKRKTSITVDPDKAERAGQLIGSSNFSETVDRALDALIREERARRDLEAYTETPEIDDERALVPSRLTGVDDDTEWTQLYRDLL